MRVTGYDYLPELKGANASIKTLGIDLAMASDLKDADIVHSHTWYANMAGHIGSLLYGIPHVVSAHSLEPLRPWKREQLGGGYEVSSWAERTAYESASGIVAVSRAMREDILRCYPAIDPDRVRVIHNGIDLDSWRAPQTEAEQERARRTFRSYGLDPSLPTIVFVGRITRQKGVPGLLRAIAKLPKEIQVILCAGAPDTPEIAAEFDGAFAELQAKRSAPVIWVPEMLPRASVRQVMTHATVFACPSVYEPLGIVNLEAMACETAVVASAVGGIPEVVVDGTTGLLVPYDPARASDPKFISAFEADFATKVNRLTGDPALAEKFGKAGRQRCIDEFSWEQIAKETITVYEKAIAFHGSR